MRLPGCASVVRPSALALIALVLVLMAGGLGAGEARASTCNQSAGIETCKFFFMGAEQTFPVPPGVSSVRVAGVGAPGGKVTDPIFGTVPGGSGAVVTAVLTVTGDKTLYVEVGGAGGDIGSKGAAGFNGGGQGSLFAGGGGGASGRFGRHCRPHGQRRRL